MNREKLVGTSDSCHLTIVHPPTSLRQDAFNASPYPLVISKAVVLSILPHAFVEAQCATGPMEVPPQLPIDFTMRLQAVKAAAIRPDLHAFSEAIVTS